MLDFESALGIEIQESDLVLCGMSKGLRGTVVRSYEVIESYRSLDADAIRSKVEQLIQKHHYNRENVVLGLPRENAVVRTLELPLDVEDNLDQVVRFQVQKQEPGDEAASAYDYSVISRDEKKKSLLLQLTLVPQADVDEWLEFLGQIGLYPAAIRLSSMGLQEVLRVHSSGSKPALILAVSADRLDAVVKLDASQCFSFHSWCHPEALDVDQILEQLDHFLPRIPVPEPQVEEIFLTGERGGEFIEELRSRFGSAQRLSTGLTVKNEAGEKADLSRMLPAMGLALTGLQRGTFSRFNLIPADRQVMGQRPSYVPTLVLGAVLLVMGMIALTSGFFQQRQRLAALKAEVSKYKPQVDETLRLRGEVETQLAEVERLKEMMQGRQVALLVMRELTERIPDDAYLQSVRIDLDKANITGYSDAAAALVTILQDSECFTDVESRYITRDRATGKDKFNFEARILCKEGVGP